MVYLDHQGKSHCPLVGEAQGPKAKLRKVVRKVPGPHREDPPGSNELRGMLRKVDLADFAQLPGLRPASEKTYACMRVRTGKPEWKMTLEVEGGGAGGKG